MKNLFSVLTALFMAVTSISAQSYVAEITKDGVKTQYENGIEFKNALESIESGDIEVKLLAACDLGYGGSNCIQFNTATTFDLNGYTLIGRIEIYAPSTINDNSEGKTGYVRAYSMTEAVYTEANTTINGGTFEGGIPVSVSGNVTVTINGGTCRAADAKTGAFCIDDGAKVVIADGYEYTDGEKSVFGTLTESSAIVDFDGSVEQITLVEIVKDGVKTKYTDAEKMMNALANITSGEIAVKLRHDCDLGDDGGNSLDFYTTATFDLNGHILTGRLNAKAAVTINDSSEGKTGKVKAHSFAYVIYAENNVTINGGTFEGYYSIRATGNAAVTLNGGTYCANEGVGAFFITGNAKVTIADGYEYTDGENQPVTGTLTEASSGVYFAGSVVAQTSTGIGTLGVKQSEKAFKTIENGRVVIIKGDEKFDLMGRKL